MVSQTCMTSGAGLERVRYFARQLITADDMLTEQQYFRQKLRRHNRYLHGWGVVCGMKVSAAPDIAEPEKPAKWPWRVKIDGGYAIGPWGDEIYVAEPSCLDLITCLDSLPDPCEPGEPPKPVPPKSGKVFVAIRYVDCETRPVRIHPLGCGCDDILCEFSRVRDDFEIACLPEPPEDERPPLLCDLRARKQLPECPPCPDSPWVVLAEVTLPAAADKPITDDNINNFVRRELYSTAIMQEQLIACCCAEAPEPTADLEITQDMTGPVEKRIFVLTVANHGPAAAHNVVVEDKRPAGGAVLANSFQITSGQWTAKTGAVLKAAIGGMQPGDTVTLRFGMRSPKGVNTAKVTSDTSDPQAANNTTTKTVG